MGDLTEGIIDAILTVANNKSFVDLVEPYVAEPQTLRRWMVKRTINALLFTIYYLQEEARREKE